MTCGNAATAPTTFAATSIPAGNNAKASLSKRSVKPTSYKGRTTDKLRQ